MQCCDKIGLVDFALINGNGMSVIDDEYALSSFSY